MAETSILSHLVFQVLSASDNHDICQDFNKVSNILKSVQSEPLSYTDAETNVHQAVLAALEKVSIDKTTMEKVTPCHEASSVFQVIQAALPRIQVAFQDSTKFNWFNTSAQDFISHRFQEAKIVWRNRLLRDLSVRFKVESGDFQQINETSFGKMLDCPSAVLYFLDCSSLEEDFQAAKLRLSEWISYRNDSEEYFDSIDAPKRQRMLIVHVVRANDDLSLGRKILKRLRSSFKGYRICQYFEHREEENTRSQENKSVRIENGSNNDFEEKLGLSIASGFSLKCRFLEDIFLSGRLHGINKLRSLETLSLLWLQVGQVKDAIRVLETLDVTFQEMLSKEELMNPIYEHNFNFSETAALPPSGSLRLSEQDSESCVRRKSLGLCVLERDSFKHNYLSFDVLCYLKFIFTRTLLLKSRGIESFSEENLLPLFLYCRSFLDRFSNLIKSRKQSVLEKETLLYYYISCGTNSGWQERCDFYFFALVEVAMALLSLLGRSISNTEHFKSLFLRPIRNILLASMDKRGLKAFLKERIGLAKCQSCLDNDAYTLSKQIPLGKAMLCVHALESLIDRNSNIFLFTSSLLEVYSQNCSADTLPISATRAILLVENSRSVKPLLDFVSVRPNISGVEAILSGYLREISEVVCSSSYFQVKSTTLTVSVEDKHTLIRCNIENCLPFRVPLDISSKVECLNRNFVLQAKDELLPGDNKLSFMANGVTTLDKITRKATVWLSLGRVKTIVEVSDLKVNPLVDDGDVCVSILKPRKYPGCKLSVIYSDRLKNFIGMGCGLRLEAGEVERTLIFSEQNPSEGFVEELSFDNFGEREIKLFVSLILEGALLAKISRVIYIENESPIEWSCSFVESDTLKILSIVCSSVKKREIEVSSASLVCQHSAKWQLVDFDESERRLLSKTTKTSFVFIVCSSRCMYEALVLQTSIGTIRLTLENCSNANGDIRN